ncbi:MAG: AraC family transcriptional regulator ligand-binding domain-containing protein [Polyangiaceae bacterium]
MEREPARKARKKSVIELTARTAPALDGNMSVRTVLPLAGWLRTRGVDVATLFQKSGIDITSLFARDVWIPRENVVEVWRTASAMFPNEHVAMRVLELADLRLIDVFQLESGFVLLQLFALSETVQAGLENISRYYGATHGTSRLELSELKSDALGEYRELCLVVADHELDCVGFVEFSLGLIIRLMHALAEKSPLLRSVHFVHAGVAGSRDHQNLLGAPVYFSSKNNAVIIPQEVLATPLRARNSEKLEQVISLVSEMLASRYVDQSLSSKVRKVIEDSLSQGAPSAEVTAKQLAISVRHLSRLLGEEGTHHQTLLDEVRAKVAEKHLVETTRPIDELPHRLGYSDASTFRRAFRRWFGCSPAELRARRRSS